LKKDYQFFIKYLKDYSKVKSLHKFLNKVEVENSLKVIHDSLVTRFVFLQTELTTILSGQSTIYEIKKILEKIHKTFASTSNLRNLIPKKLISSEIPKLSHFHSLIQLNFANQTKFLKRYDLNDPTIVTDPETFFTTLKEKLEHGKKFYKVFSKLIKLEDYRLIINQLSKKFKDYFDESKL
jgi:hypothetical protein